MKNNIVEKVRKFVEEECRRNPAGQGFDPYIYHFTIVRDYSLKLAKIFKANTEIVEIAALSHDIGSIIYGREKHHITGTKIMGKKLLELNYPKENIRQVLHCILAHRGSNGIKSKTMEARIISDADAIACFDDIAGIFQAAFCWEGHTSRESANKSVIEKLTRKWDNLYFPESHELVKDKYEAAMLLLK